jgi:hypothetical protein
MQVLIVLMASSAVALPTGRRYCHSISGVTPVSSVAQPGELLALSLRPYVVCFLWVCTVAETASQASEDMQALHLDEEP